MSERVEKSHLIIALIGTLTVLGGFIVRWHIGNPLGIFEMALWGSVVLVAFYILGRIARAFLMDIFKAPKEKKLELAPGAEVDEDEDPEFAAGVSYADVIAEIERDYGDDDMYVNSEQELQPVMD